MSKNDFPEDAMELRTVPLAEYCRKTGYSLRYIRSILNGEDAELRKRFCLSGAVVRRGGRWHVSPTHLKRWDQEQTMAWADSQQIN